jgi:hypothetical protein
MIMPQVQESIFVAPQRPISATGAKPSPLTPEERHRMIAEAAYYLAEKRRFQGGDPLLDWLEAERAIDRFLRRPRRLGLRFLAGAPENIWQAVFDGA